MAVGRLAGIVMTRRNLARSWGSSVQNPIAMKTTNIIMLSLAVSACGLVACSEQPRDTGSMERQVDEAMNDLRADKDELAAEFRELREDISKRMAEIENELGDPDLTAENRADFEQEKKELNEQLDRVDDGASKLENATKETWQDVKSGAKKTANDVENWFERQAEKIDKETKADADHDGH